MTLEVLDTPVLTLQEFISNNPESDLAENDNSYIINKPWGDETLIFEIQKNNKEAIKSLNFLRLLPRFTGLWHRDTGDLEFIFTYIKNDDPICSNSFLFNFKGQSFKCGYSKGTDRLQQILEIAKPIARASDSNYRNLGTLNLIKTFHERARSGYARFVSTYIVFYEKCSRK